MITTQAWVLPTGPEPQRPPVAGELVEREITVPDLADDEVLIEPIFGSWEGNMSHAVARDPVDVGRQRGEDAIVLGNAGVVRVLKPGAAVGHVKEGDLCMVFSAGVYDAFGYGVLAFAYDAPNTVGLLAKRTKIPGKSLFVLPSSSRFSLQQWAAFSLKYLTAWSNWRVAIGALRLQMTEEDEPHPFVWGWGGGSTLAELDLARRAGCRATFLVGNEERQREAQAMGLDVVDRRRFEGLSHDPERYGSDAAYRQRYDQAEKAFLREVRERTGGQGAAIFIDYIGTPVLRATLRALGRLGVLATAGWKGGMNHQVVRAVECIKRHIHVHTHYARWSEAPAAMAYAEEQGWMPQVTSEYDWSEVPRLAREHSQGEVSSYFPIYRVNPL